MLKIEQISNSDQDRIDQCINQAERNYLDNFVLLGDLYPPCNKLTRIIGIFDSKEDLLAFFTIFYGFQHPSVVLPHVFPDELFIQVMEYLRKEMPAFFTVVSFKLSEKDLARFFEIPEVSNEQCMFVTRKDEITLFTLPELKRYQGENLESVNTFYQAINQYPWNPMQLTSGFYHYIEIDGKIVACGGTHLETPRLAQLGNIYVLSGYRGMSYGKILVSNITYEILKQKKIATLFVARDNTVAISLYQKLGYRFYKPVKIIACYSPVTA